MWWQPCNVWAFEAKRLEAAAHGPSQAVMALSEEQQEALATHAEVMVARLTALTRRHHALLDDSAGPQLRPPVSRPNGSATPVCHAAPNTSESPA